MDPKNLVKLIVKSLPDLKDGSKWQASHTVDGVPTPQRPKVQQFGCGLKDGEIWFRFQFTEDGQPVDLHGTYSLTKDVEEITVNNQPVDADDVIVSHRFAGFMLRGVIEFQFERDGKTHRYRFDATLYSPL